MKTKLLALMLALLMCFNVIAMAACGKDEPTPPSDTDGSTESGETTESEGTTTEPDETTTKPEETTTDPPVENKISFKTLSLDGTTVTGKVSNTMQEFSFVDEIEVSGDATYVVSMDQYGTQTVVTKTIPLREGDNTVYVIEIVGDDTTVYTVTIRRRSMYTVDFNTNGGTEVASQSIEEGNTVTMPVDPIKIGYEFAGWDFDFETPINESITIQAAWNILPELQDYEFVFDGNNCSITGVKNKTKTEYIIPDYVTNISEGIFNGCANMESITLPFVGGSIKTENDTNQFPFGYIFGTDSYTGGAVTDQYYYGSSTSSTTSTIYYIPASLKTVVITGGNILRGAFYNCSSLTSITIPNNVTSIGSYAFEDCSSLTSVTIGNSVTSIGDDAFSSCCSLTSITIPNSVTSIGEYAFIGCCKLVEVINHSSLSITAGSWDYGYVAYYAKEVHSGESKIVNVNDYLFYTYNNVNYLLGYVGADTTLTLPANYNGQNYEIYQYAFYERNDLTSVTIPNSVTSIGDEAFYGCYSLTSVTIGNSVTSIGYHAFMFCDSFTSVTIGNSVTSIGYEAFRSCYSLTSVTFENTQGWRAGETAISSSHLANPSTAATYLKETYCYYDWTRS